ncbi:MAG: hypothetical protein ACRDY3_09675 [Acidimicrobiales bacterium]
MYAPAGAVLSALDDVPGMAARGRTLVEQEVRNAHLLGQLAVHEGQRRLRRRLDRPDRDRSASPPTASPPTPFPPAPSPPPASPPAPPRDATPPPAPPRGTGPTGPTGPAPRGPAGTGIPGPAIDGGAGADLAIPGYDTLPASQVVRRLDGLGPTELAAVFRHESAGRGRRTILHRAQQLLGRTDRPRSAGS